MSLFPPILLEAKMRETNNINKLKGGNKIKMEKPNREIEGKKETKTDEMSKKLALKKLNFLTKMNLGDLIAFFDLVNAVSIGRSGFVTENELILSIKDRLESRIGEFEILTPKEADRISDKEEEKVTIPNLNRRYLG